ncbi:MAG: ABC transporter substrate-binding protein [Actinomycetota bacterium]
MRLSLPALFLTGVLLAPPAAGETPATPVAKIRLPFPSDDGSLTPYTFELGYPFVTLVYDTLLWRDSSGIPQPWLARSLETSPDGRRITVRLDPRARWHDGIPLTSSDVAFTFELMGIRPHPRFAGGLAVVEAVGTPDPATAVIRLAHPSLGFPDQPLADLPILPRHLWEGLPQDRLAPEGLPVGSGPYRLAEYRPGEGYRFEADPAYFRGPPAVARLEVPIIRDPEETFRALERGEVDMIPVSLPKAASTRLERLGIRVVRGPSYLGIVLMLNLRRAPFDRPEARRAVAAALDLPRIARAVGDARPADRGFLHPESRWASTELLHRPDLAAARDLVRMGLPPLRALVANNDPVKLEAGRQVVLALERAGARAELQQSTAEEVSRMVGEDGSEPTFDLAIWTAPPLASYDPDFLRRLFGSDPEQAPFNYSGYASPAFDELAGRIAAEPAPAARKAAVSEALRLLATDLPVVPLIFAGGTYAYRPSVYSGWVFIKGAGILDKRSFLEPARPGPGTAPGPEASPGGGPSFPFGLAAVGILIAAAILGVAQLLRLRR